jgi:hypothetical protein
MSPSNHDEIPAEIDFAGGVRGKFHRQGTTQRLNLPVYLEDPLRARLAELASAKGIELSVLVNDLLRKDLELIDMAR